MSNDPDISNPTVQPDTTTIYIVESREVGINMLLNGSFELGNVDPDWVQIMPPAGEFSWIAANQLDLKPKRPLRP